MPKWLWWIGALSGLATFLYDKGLHSSAAIAPDAATGQAIRLSSGRYGGGAPVFITQEQELALVLLALPGVAVLIWWAVIKARRP